jgi:hypothetical protein
LPLDKFLSSLFDIGGKLCRAYPLLYTATPPDFLLSKVSISFDIDTLGYPRKRGLNRPLTAITIEFKGLLNLSLMEARKI